MTEQVVEHEYEWPRRPTPPGERGCAHPFGALGIEPQPGEAQCGRIRAEHKYRGRDLPEWPEAWPGLDVWIDRGTDAEPIEGRVVSVPQTADGTPTMLVLMVGTMAYAQEYVVPWVAVKAARSARR